jgi:hypothetical protein
MSLFWQLPASVRSLAAPACRRYSVTARQAREPLDILFCGSDAFSVKSLDVICEARREVPGLIGRIEVVHRPAKRTGRGMKVLTEGKSHTHTHSSLQSFVRIASNFWIIQSQSTPTQPPSTSQLTPSTPSPNGPQTSPSPSPSQSPSAS